VKIEVDGSRCGGYGFCEQSAPEMLALDDPGVLHALVVEVPDAQAALARRVARFEVGTSQRRLNQLVRGLSSLPTTVTAA
jgi:ferredoxin